MGSWGREDSWQGSGWRPREVVGCGTGQARLQLADPTRWWLADPVTPHSHIDKPG